jgi:hypothetical protein
VLHDFNYPEGGKIGNNPPHLLSDRTPSFWNVVILTYHNIVCCRQRRKSAFLPTVMDERRRPTEVLASKEVGIAALLNIPF